VTAEALGHAVNAARDTWFARDPDDWVAHHAFYPGVVERVTAVVAAGGVHVVVVTTKAERFTRALLGSRSERLATLPVVGREPGRAVRKPETLGRLAAEHGLVDGAGLWFVEDLLETLDAAHAERALARAGLFLAAWGYNTLEDRAGSSLRPDVTLLSLARFAGPFAGWR